MIYTINTINKVISIDSPISFEELEKLFKTLVTQGIITKDYSIVSTEEAKTNCQWYSYPFHEHPMLYHYDISCTNCTNGTHCTCGIK